ncbi:hypothetical protein LINPERHAP1_LOCUS41082 [Linum perenne]
MSFSSVIFIDRMNGVSCFFSHAMNHCRKRNFCNYCKKPGHIILDCRLRRARHGNDRGNSYGARGTSYGDPGNSYGDRVTNQGSNYGHSTTPTAYMTSSSSNMPNSNDTASMDHLVQAALQRVLPSALTAAFSSVGISGNSSPWFIDSASFNHMSRHRGLFTSYKPFSYKVGEVIYGSLPLLFSDAFFSSLFFCSSPSLNLSFLSSHSSEPHLQASPLAGNFLARVLIPIQPYIEKLFFTTHLKLLTLTVPRLLQVMWLSLLASVTTLSPPLSSG